MGLALPGLASAATFNVDRVDDPLTGGAATCTDQPNDCSLRQAIKLANEDPATADTVNVPAGHYTLAARPLDPYTDMTIKGAGARGTIIDANNASGVFNLNSPDNSTATTVQISDVQLTGGTGDTGGAISARINLTLTRSTVQGNSAVSGGGIGVPLPAESNPPMPVVRLVDSTVSGNSARNGGGIYNLYGDMTVINSTISGNTATGTKNKDGFSSGGDGGGIYSSVASVETHVSLFSTTVADNNANGNGGNIFIDRGDTAFAGFVPGVSAPAFQLTNTIVSGGQAGNSGGNCSGGINPISRGFNLFSDGTCGAKKSSDVSGDPQLKPLSDTGGQTDTRLPADGSPAIDAGDPSCTDGSGAALTRDQRTVARPQGDGCDIGSVEFAPPGPKTGDPTGITSTTARLNGSASNPGAKPGSAHFEWGTTTDYGQTAGNDEGLAGANGKLLVGPVRFKTVAAGAGASSFSADLTGLQPGTTYHYRVTTSNTDASRVGADVAFTTPNTPKGQPEPNPTPTPRRPHSPKVRASRLGGRCYRTRFTARIRVQVSSATALRMVHVKLDGKAVVTSKTGSFVVRVNVSGLRRGYHVLVIRATDRAGNTTTLRRSFTRCRRRTAAPQFTG